jgi:hypothetical protein
MLEAEITKAEVILGDSGSHQANRAEATCASCALDTIDSVKIDL